MSGPILPSGGQLLGREREREVLDRLLDGVRGGRGGVLVVHGEAGVGKTALLEYAVEAAREFRTLLEYAVEAAREFRTARTSGVEAEMELPFAAVQQLFSPFLDFWDRLPQPQHESLGVAVGLIGGPAHPAPNPFLVGLPVLGLLSEAAKERPPLAVVDDAHAVGWSRTVGRHDARRAGLLPRLINPTPRDFGS
jgi:AAA ATPase domain